MRNTLVLFAFTAALACAADTKAALPAGLPKGAIQSAPQTWRYTDAKGKKWVYYRTPFGFSKSEDVPETPQAPVPDTNPAKVTVVGDSVKFERTTPFGVQSWTKKKADLTDDEKALMDKALMEKPRDQGQQ